MRYFDMRYVRRPFFLKGLFGSSGSPWRCTYIGYWVTPSEIGFSIESGRGAACSSPLFIRTTAPATLVCSTKAVSRGTSFMRAYDATIPMVGQVSFFADGSGRCKTHYMILVRERRVRTAGVIAPAPKSLTNRSLFCGN